MSDDGAPDQAGAPQSASSPDQLTAFDTAEQAANTQRNQQTQQAFDTGRSRQAFTRNMMRKNTQQALRQNALAGSIQGAAPTPTT